MEFDKSKAYNGTKYYHLIPGLLISKSILSLSYDQIDADINGFIDMVPGLIEKIESNFGDIENRDRHLFFTKNMELLLSLLRKVYARTLESEAEKILRCSKDTSNLDVARKLLKPFISDVLSMSIAMQEARGQAATAEESTLTTIELHADSAKNVAAVSSLFDDREYAKAGAMLKELAEHDPDEPAYAKVGELISIKNYGEAKNILDELTSKHAISQLIQSDLSKKVLVVDDMPEILAYVNNALKNHFKVVAVPSGEAAVKVMESQKIDLFILDIDMPGMSGYELSGKIRATMTYADTPIIFLTGNSSRERVGKAIAVGCNGFIVKPASYECLLTKVGKFLNVDK